MYAASRFLRHSDITTTARIFVTHTAMDNNNNSPNVDAVLNGFGVGSTVWGRFTTAYNSVSPSSSLNFAMPMQFEFTPIPEPATGAVLAGVGLLAFAGWRRYRKPDDDPIIARSGKREV